MTESSSEHADLQDAFPGIILCGASVRAVAEAAAAAGVKFWCTDLFHDLDLCDLVRQHGGTLLPRPAALADLSPILRQVDASIPLLCCGGMENEVKLLEQLEQSRPVLGPSAAAVQRLRDPFWLQQILTGTAVPLAGTVAERPAAPHGWLMKPLHSAAGIGIRRLDDPALELAAAPMETPVCFQQRLEGQPFSVMVCSKDSGVRISSAVLQLNGWSELCAGDYLWCGVVGPFALPEWLHRQLLQTATLLTKQSGAVGIWGMDLMLTEHGAILLEVNPRIPASFWLHEVNEPGRLIRDLLNAVSTMANPQAATGQYEIHGQYPEAAPWGQIILRSDCDVAAAMACPDPSLLSDSVRIADRPHPDQTIVSGSPICSLLFPAADDCGKQWVIQADVDGERRNSSGSSHWDFELIAERLNRTVHAFLERLNATNGESG